MGRGERNHKPRATAISRGAVGRKPEAKCGLDEQKPDKRPSYPGKEAIDSDARYSPGGYEGKSGEGREKDSRLTPGDQYPCS